MNDLASTPGTPDVQTGRHASQFPVVGPLAAIVEQYIHMVYASALRQTQNPSTAEDVTQAVFLVLTRRAPHLPKEAHMAGWLLKTTAYAVKAARRAATRRHYHERQAAALQNEAQDSTASANHALLTLVDDALLHLPATDRELLCRRYLLGQPVNRLAPALSLSENAATKRLTRALEKLRVRFSREGITTPSDALASALTAQSLLHAPPALLAATAPGATASAASLLIAEWVSHVMLLGKLAYGAVAAAVLLTSAFVLGHYLASDRATGGQTSALAPAVQLLETRPDTDPTDLAAIESRLAAMQNLSFSYRTNEPSSRTVADSAGGAFSLVVTRGIRDESFLRLGEKFLWKSNLLPGQGLTQDTKTDAFSAVRSEVLNLTDGSALAIIGSKPIMPVSWPAIGLGLFGSPDAYDHLLTRDDIHKMALLKTRDNHILMRAADAKGRTHEWEILPEYGYSVSAYRLRVSNDVLNIEVTAADFKAVGGLLLPHAFAWHIYAGPDQAGKEVSGATATITEYQLNDPGNTADRYHIHWPPNISVRDGQRILYSDDSGNLVPQRPAGTASQGQTPSRPIDALHLRYSQIFNKLHEKDDFERELDYYLRQRQLAGDSSNDLEAYRADAILHAQARLWCKMEAAAKVVAARHGVDATIPETIPEVTEDWTGSWAALNDLIQQRMVIPLDELMAQEVLDMLNNQYDQQKTQASTQPK